MIVKYLNKENKSKTPSPMNKYHSKGLYYFKTGKYEKAIECFKKVLIIDPNHLDSKNKIKILIKKLEEKKNRFNEEITATNILQNGKKVAKHKGLSDSKIKYFEEIFQLHKEFGTFERVARKVSLTSERVEQILKKGNENGLFKYPIKEIQIPSLNKTKEKSEESFEIRKKRTLKDLIKEGKEQGYLT